VFYLELAQYEKAFGVLDTYYDAIVNIFTRLNKAGRELSREDIAFAWLKTGWNAGATSNNGAKACITRQLKELDLELSDENVISAVSFIWSTSFNSGKLLNNSDLVAWRRY
jgi:hypothetical protein